MGKIQRMLGQLGKRFISNDVSAYVNRSLFPSRVACMFPLNEHFKLSNLECVKGAVLMALIVANMTYTTYDFLRRRYLFKSEAGKTVLITQMTAITLCVVVCYAFYINNRESYCNVFKSLQQINKDIKSRGSSINYNLLPVILSNFFAFTTCIVEGILSFQSFANALTGITFTYLMRQTLTTIFMCLFIHFLTSPIIICLSVLKKQFEYATDKLISIKNDGTSPIETKAVQRLVDIHNSLCEASFELNDAMGFQQLTLTASIYLIVVSSTYMLLVKAQSLSAWKLNTLLLQSIFWLALWVLELFYIVYMCDSTVNQSRHFNRQLFQIMLYDRKNDLSKNDKLQIHLTMKTEAHFTACGLFPVDYTLLHSMAATATTNLVILVQFEDTATES